MKFYNLTTLGMGGKLTLLVSSIASILAPIQALSVCIILFILTDFAFGLIVSVRVKKQGFISKKAYHTIWKLIGAEVCVLLAWVLDVHVLTFMPTLFLPNIFTGLICGADLWSILTNFAILSHHPIFRVIKKWGRCEIENKLGVDLAVELEKNN